jgi:hypothetical protein
MRATIDVCGYAHICFVLAVRKTECPVEGTGTEVSVGQSLVASDLAPAKAWVANHLTGQSLNVERRWE